MLNILLRPMKGAFIDVESPFCYEFPYGRHRGPRLGFFPRLLMCEPLSVFLDIKCFVGIH